MIRKEGKARWTYTCELCEDKQEAFDQFRAIEYGQWHEKTYAHASATLAASFTKLANDLTEALRPAMDAFASIAEALATTPNIPHDPTLRGDRRKWGGK